MKIVILGSGTYQPKIDRHCSSYLIKTDSKNLVFDFGRGAIDQLLKAGIKYYNIDVIFITHTHADHCSELGSFLQIALAEPQEARYRNKDLVIYGPAGIKDTIKHLLDAFGLSDKEPKFKIEVRELKNNDSIKAENWMVKSFEVKHSTKNKCLAYRLESSNKVIAYSGDTEYCEGLKSACKDADLAVIETNNPNELEKQGHMTGRLTGKIAFESKVKKLVVAHVSPEYLEDFKVLEDIKKIYKGPVVLAEDMMKINV